MPKLTWVGKDKVVNHHHEVPFRVLEHQYNFTASGDNSQENKVIHGDNLVALKSLLPEYEGKVKCIYIDPPYNTGNEGWVYNDNVNDEKIKKWLGQVVGKEGEDLSRHDKWLCMMYPRLKLLHKLLADNGVILISIDEIEQANLKSILDEIFGLKNRVGVIVWKNATDNNPTNISTEHEYIFCYAKNKDLIPPEWKTENNAVKDKLIEIGDKLISQHNDLDELQAAYTKWFRKNKAYLWHFDRYKFIDFDGVYTGSQSVHNPGKEGYRYDVIHPTTQKACVEPLMGYRFPQTTMQKLLDEKRILFGENETKIIELKVYAKDYRAKLSSVIELDGRLGANELRVIFPEVKKTFDHPKATALLEEIFSFVTKGNDIILDSFAGSGTTAHSILKLNTEDGGNRKFILIETMDYAETITAERVRRVMQGYGEHSKAVEGLGGGFGYYEIGDAIFLEDGNLNESIAVEEIRRYVAFSENIPAERQVSQDNETSPYLLGFTDETAYFFIYEKEDTTTLNLEFLANLSFKPESLVVYADNCLLTREFLQKHNIIFKKIPREIIRF